MGDASAPTRMERRFGQIARPGWSGVYPSRAAQAPPPLILTAPAPTRMRIPGTVCSGTSIDHSLYERECLFDEIGRQIMGEEAGVNEQVVEIGLILVTAVIMIQVGIVFVIAALD
jgi:hypothetical protein